jgi:predicted lipoprotein with Yx(FWY)xxD motif
MSSPILARPLLRRRLTVPTAVTVLLLVLAACAQSGSGTSTPSATASTEATPSASVAASESQAAGESYEVTVSETSAGSALAGENGMTLYTFDNDSNGQSACNEGCVENWPPFTVDAGEEATAGAGVGGELGTITRADGDTQVTYNGAPLYYYGGDQAAGDATGDGLGGVWHIAAP